MKQRLQAPGDLLLQGGDAGHDILGLLRGRLKAWIEGRKGTYTLTEVRTAFGTLEETYLETLRDLIDKKEVPPYQE